MQWTPSDVDKVLKTVDVLLNGFAEKVIAFRRGESDTDIQFLQTAGKHNRWLLLALVLFLSGLVGLMSYLATKGVVTGDALLFLVGSITAYLIVLIQRLIRWTNPVRPREGD
jgi:hypothetical protein